MGEKGIVETGFLQFNLKDGMTFNAVGLLLNFPVPYVPAEINEAYCHSKACTLALLEPYGFTKSLRHARCFMRFRYYCLATNISPRDVYSTLLFRKYCQVVGGIAMDDLVVHREYHLANIHWDRIATMQFVFAAEAQKGNVVPYNADKLTKSVFPAYDEFDRAVELPASPIAVSVFDECGWAHNDDDFVVNIPIMDDLALGQRSFMHPIKALAVVPAIALPMICGNKLGRSVFYHDRTGIADLVCRSGFLPTGSYVSTSYPGTYHALILSKYGHKPRHHAPQTLLGDTITYWGFVSSPDDLGKSMLDLVLRPKKWLMQQPFIDLGKFSIQGCIDGIYLISSKRAVKISYFKDGFVPLKIPPLYKKSFARTLSLFDVCYRGSVDDYWYLPLATGRIPIESFDYRVELFTINDKVFVSLFCRIDFPCVIVTNNDYESGYFGQTFKGPTLRELVHTSQYPVYCVGSTWYDTSIYTDRFVRQCYMPGSMRLLFSVPNEDRRGRYLSERHLVVVTINDHHFKHFGVNGQMPLTEELDAFKLF